MYFIVLTYFCERAYSPRVDVPLVRVDTRALLTGAFPASPHSVGSVVLGPRVCLGGTETNTLYESFCGSRRSCMESDDRP